MDPFEAPDTSESDFPGFTKWVERDACCFKTKYIPALDASFCGHWEIKPLVPIGVFLLSISSFVVSVVYIFPYLGSEKIVAIPLISVIFVLYLVSYVRIIVDGPGYYPFFWGYKTSEPPGTFLMEDFINDDNDIMAGVISTEQQLEWAKLQPKPPRSILSRSARRIILRPDHLCSWTETWIGKRNHKFFLLFNMYCFLYLFVFVVYDARIVTLIANTQQPVSVRMALGIAGFVAAAFVLMTGSFLATTCYDAFSNRTSWEQWNNIDFKKYDKGFISNLEDVFGPRNQWFWWFCPVSPWKGKSNDEISNGYLSYYD